jgi:hypothetical protein
VNKVVRCVDTPELRPKGRCIENEEVRIVEHRDLDACRREGRRQTPLGPIVARIDELGVLDARLRQQDIFVPRITFPSKKGQDPYQALPSFPTGKFTWARSQRQ